MNVLVAFLAVTGAMAWLMVVGGFIFGVFFRGASDEDRATVEIPAPDVDLAERIAPFTSRPADVTNVRVLRPGDRPRLMHDPDNCSVCAGIDRSGF